ncbi:MAG: sigma-54 dependent transcriptional regulator [bacterium]|nr:sigma-54 dependent transcriptional regulator [bacterium]
MSKAPRPAWILIADDELSHRTMLRACLQNLGYSTLEVSDGRAAVETAKREKPALIIMDLRMPELDGMAALKAIRVFNPHVPVLMMTAHGSIQSAVEAIKNGAYDYLEKPVDINDVQHAVENGLHFGDLKRSEAPAPPGDVLQATTGMIWKSPLMADILDTVTRVAPSDASVLITGESGTGKEIIADMIQRLSTRADKPFIKVNCAALHEQLLESELFGHERGAFTGAHEQRRGRFELAHHGTLFLDEIGDMAPTTQAKILRVLQSGTFERLGAIDTISVDVRIVAATNHELKQAIEKGGFRKDLFFRLSVVPIHLPPLRDRIEEIPLLADHFLDMYVRKNRRTIRGFMPEATQALLRYDWPGNVRELENAVERAVILTVGDMIGPDVLPAHIRGGEAPRAENGEQLTMLEQAERDLIVQAMLACAGNRTKAAEQLGMSRRSLYNKLKRYGLANA